MPIPFISAVLSVLTGGGIKAVSLKAQRLIEEAEEQKRQMLLEAREEGLRIRSIAEEEATERRRELKAQQNRQSQLEESLERKIGTLEQHEKDVNAKELSLEELRKEIEALKNKHIQQLESIAGVTATEAREVVLTRAENEMKHDLAKRYYELEQQMQKEADEKARKVVTLAIQRLATDVVSERTSSRVALPNDEMKGRLIGREGRNIRALEAATGVDILIDDTPEMVTISCFDPVRREVARLALEKLIQDGRIHPTRIEDMVRRAQEEVEESIQRAGEEATFESGVRGVHPELVKLLGRLKYRYSYGENILKHAVEVSLLAGMMATEMGANVEVSKAGGLLHDIGKALTHEVQGTHAEIGGDIAQKYHIHPAVHQAIMEHHDEGRGSVEAFLVAAADAVSAARPGARKESLEQYIQRLEALEAIATSFEGVEKAYAIQAGREVRIMVKPNDVDDIAASALARDIAKRVEGELVYPGQIQVTVIRETRKVELAR